jgi:hypothetical protein
MLAIVSDLHFQHTSNDVLRWHEDGEVHTLEVDLNVTGDAIRRICSVIDENARRRRSKDIEVVLAGDVFELHRTPLWFFTATHVRPTQSDLGPDDREKNPLCDLTHRVLDAVEADCADCWPVWHRFVDEGRFEHYDEARGVPVHVERVRVHYLPGNHDRLANAWPSVRRRVRQLLRVHGDGEPFPHTVDRPFDDDGAGYGVRVRHGHEYDDWNFGRPVAKGKALSASEEDYLAPSLGDYLTVDVATRLATGFRARYGKELRESGPAGEAMRRLYVAITEFDDVRPFSLLMHYLSREFGHDDARTFETLRPLLRDIASAASVDPFFQKEAMRFGLPPVAIAAIQHALKTAPLGLLAGGIEAATKITGHPEALELGGSQPPAEIACYEPGLAEGDFDTVIAGHTHLPDQVPLPTPARKKRIERRTREEGLFFIDSGTWRTSIRKGANHCFGRVRACTIVLAYDESERSRPGKEREGRRFETWTGHLASGSVGPKKSVLGKLAPPAQRLLFQALHVERVDEGDTRDGAELRLAVGVDGEARPLQLDGVKNGKTIALDFVAPVPLWPSLDGELWFYGHEEDLGAFPIDPDDLLPWALRPLARESAKFREGDGSMELVDRGTKLRLSWRVEAIS